MISKILKSLGSAAEGIETERHIKCQINVKGMEMWLILMNDCISFLLSETYSAKFKAQSSVILQPRVHDPSFNHSKLENNN